MCVCSSYVNLYTYTWSRTNTCNIVKDICIKILRLNFSTLLDFFPTSQRLLYTEQKHPQNMVYRFDVIFCCLGHSSYPLKKYVLFLPMLQISSEEVTSISIPYISYLSTWNTAQIFFYFHLCELTFRTVMTLTLKVIMIPCLKAFALSSTQVWLALRHYIRSPWFHVYLLIMAYAICR